ncbi:hypothetical protein KI387_034962, partial [Taxus chinensis]
SEEEEEESCPIEEDPKDHSYHMVFTHNFFLNVVEENPILEPSNEDKISIQEYDERQD